jgi:hypothetical protein
MMTLGYGGEVCSFGNSPMSSGSKQTALSVPCQRFCCLNLPPCESFRSLSTINLLMATPN